MAKKRIRELPNPDAYREPCVGPQCIGCNKVFIPPEIVHPVLEDCVCEAYSKPSIWKGNCPMNSRNVDIGETKKINPIKASKRSRRRG